MSKYKCKLTHRQSLLLVLCTPPQSIIEIEITNQWRGAQTQIVSALLKGPDVESFPVQLGLPTYPKRWTWKTLFCKISLSNTIQHGNPPNYCNSFSGAGQYKNPRFRNYATGVYHARHNVHCRISQGNTCYNLFDLKWLPYNTYQPGYSNLTIKTDEVFSG